VQVKVQKSAERTQLKCRFCHRFRGHSALPLHFKCRLFQFVPNVHGVLFFFLASKKIKLFPWRLGFDSFFELFSSQSFSVVHFTLTIVMPKLKNQTKILQASAFSPLFSHTVN